MTKILFTSSSNTFTFLALTLPKIRRSDLGNDFEVALRETTLAKSEDPQLFGSVTTVFSAPLWKTCWQSEEFKSSALQYISSFCEFGCFKQSNSFQLESWFMLASAPGGPAIETLPTNEDSEVSFSTNNTISQFSIL